MYRSDHLHSYACGTFQNDAINISIRLCTFFYQSLQVWPRKKSEQMNQKNDSGSYRKNKS